MSDQVYRFEVGDFKCMVVKDIDEEIALINEVFIDVPEEELFEVCDGLGYAREVIVGYNVLYIDTGEKKVLIDVGTGAHNLAENLRSVGVENKDIDVVIITHGDNDHVGGLLNKNGEFAFEKAQVILWQGAWDLWTNEVKREGMVGELMKLYEPMELSEEQLASSKDRRVAYGSKTLPKIRESITLVELGEEFLSGFRLVGAPGHRSDHVGLEIVSGEKTLLHIADSFWHPIQALQPQFYGEFDSNSERVQEVNRNLFARAVENQGLIFGSHLPFPGLATVKQANENWIMELIDGNDA